MRRRILLLVFGMTTLVVLAFAVPLAVLIRNEATDRAVTGLKNDTSNIGFFLRRYNSTPTTVQLRAELRKIGFAASVQLPNGQVVGAPPPGGIGALPSAPADPSLGGRGSDPPEAGSSNTSGNTSNAAARNTPSGDGGPQPTPVAWHGGLLSQLRVPALGQQGAYTVRVYATDGSLHSGENGPWLLLAVASVALLVLGGGLGELLTRRIVRPLMNTAETAQRLAAGDVTARAPTSGPAEIADVGRALNRLADRIDQLIAEERETVADLSHRLRTPLTALRLDAEALRDPAEAERIGAHAGALERMLTAVIHAARRPQREGRMPACDATAVVGQRVRFWSALTEDQQRQATVSLPAIPVVVRAAAEDLAAAVDALLENIVAHTPEGTAFSVCLSATTAGARLQIGDDGPGMPADPPIRGRSERGSSGLGLDIARRCARASGGDLTLGSTRVGGALVTLDLGSA